MATMRNGLAAVAMVSGFLVALPASSLAQKRQRDVITREEIAASASKDLDLFQVIRNLRPHFLEPRPGVRTMGNASVAPVAIYVDRRRDSGIDALRSIPPSMVEEVRYLDPTKSADEFGITVNGGAVLVKLRKEPKQAGDTLSTSP